MSDILRIVLDEGKLLFILLGDLKDVTGSMVPTVLFILSEFSLHVPWLWIIKYKPFSSYSYKEYEDIETFLPSIMTQYCMIYDYTFCNISYNCDHNHCSKAIKTPEMPR